MNKTANNATSGGNVASGVTSSVTSIEEALEVLGVTEKTLNAQEKKALDEQGYIILPNLIDRAWLGRLRDRYEELAQADRLEVGNAGRQERGTRHLGDLINRGEVFDGIYTQPKLLAAIYYVFKRDFRVVGLHGRDPLPDFGQQGLHADWMPRQPYDPFIVANSIWLLDDFTLTNGATRVVPGSHLFKGGPDKAKAAQPGAHPKEIVVTARAGSVLVFNAHLWHSGTLNQSKAVRRTIQCLFAAREIQQFQNTPGEVVQEATLERLSPAARYLLNV